MENKMEAATGYIGVLLGIIGGIYRLNIGVSIVDI